MNIKQEETGSPKNIFMFEFHKGNVSGIDYLRYSKSPPCTMNSLMWRILITKKKAENNCKDPKDTLGIYLECLGKSKLWSCLAYVRFTLISQKPDCKSLSMEFKHLFSALSVSQGFHTFITWDRLCNAANGYVNNDMIRIQAYVEADVPKNISTLDYNMQIPQSSDDWLYLFESKLNDKIVRRICEEIKASNEKNMKSFGKLFEDIKRLHEKMERIHNGGIKIMSECFIKSLKVVLASFYSKMNSLKLDNFHTEMVSVLEELRRIRSAEAEREAKANEKPRNENDEANSCSESESGCRETAETGAPCGKNGETETDCEIVEEKAHETIEIGSSESGDDQNARKNAPVEETEENSRVVPKPVCVLKFFKTLLSECLQESSKCCQEKLGCSFRVCGGHDAGVPRPCSGVCSTSNPRPAQANAECCELSSQMNCSSSLVQVQSGCLKRKLDQNNCVCSSAPVDPPQKKNCFIKDEAADDDSDDSSSSSSSSCSCSCSSSSESSPSKRTDDEKSPVKQPKSPVKQPKSPVKQPKLPVKQPKLPVEQPKLPVEQPKLPVEQPKSPVKQPKWTSFLESRKRFEKKKSATLRYDEKK